MAHNENFKLSSAIVELSKILYGILIMKQEAQTRSTCVGGGLINFLDRVSNWLPDLLFMTSIDFTAREKFRVNNVT